MKYFLLGALKAVSVGLLVLLIFTVVIGWLCLIMFNVMFITTNTVAQGVLFFIGAWLTMEAIFGGIREYQNKANR